VLAARARTELVATGARPRRPARSGTESLTASQRRVAELAARGLTNRQIADSLFVTPKTVEFHLRHIYQKLHLSSREQFAEAIAPR
jgi:DNA-binding CsgD family transcriptional regulator